jgi:protein PhnA
MTPFPITTLRENTMSATPACPQCTLENTYPDGANYVCADCGFEWPQGAAAAEEEGERIVKDANGNVLQSGDSVVVIKDLKVKGTSTTLKQGSKIKGIRIVDGDHEVDCKTDVGQMLLKACYLRKV